MKKHILSFALLLLLITQAKAQKPVANFTASADTICANVCVYFTDLSTNNPTSWLWTFTGALPATSTDENPPNVCYADSGNYSVTLITSNSQGSDTLTLNNFIIVKPNPLSLVISNSPICTGDTLNLSASEGASYFWSGPNAFNSTLQNPFITNTSTSASGTYIVIVIDSNGCTASASTSVAIYQAPIINPVGNQTLCNGSTAATVNFSGTGSGYRWTNNTPSIGLAASGTGNIASFTATDSGASPVTATITVTSKSASSGGNAYIANNQSNSVSVINTATNLVTSTIGVGDWPLGISVSTDGSRVYVSNSHSNSVSVINAVTNTVIATIGVGDNPYALSVTPDGSKVYVANDYSNSVSVINTVIETVIATIAVGSDPNGTAVSPDGSTVYVANNASNTISVINTVTNTVSATIAVGNYPEGVIVSPDGSWLYVDVRDDNAVAVINTATNTITTTIALGTNPNCISISPDGSRVYTSNLSTNTVSVINTATDTVIASIAVGDYPAGTSISPDGSLLYVANYYSNTVSAINTTTNSVIATIDVGDGPFSLGNFVNGNDNGCSGTPKTFTITVNPTPATPVITIVGTTLYCNTNSSYTSYQWYYDNSLIPGATDTFLVVAFNGNYNVEVTDQEGCSVAVGINFTVGIPNYVTDNAISISPNPATNQLTIHTSSSADWHKAAVSIMNVLGQETSPPAPLQRGGEETVIDVSKLPAGIYFVTVSNESSRQVAKFVKE